MNASFRRARPMLAGLAVALAVSLPGVAAAETASVRYRITYGSIPIGHADTTVRVNDGAYEVGSSFASGGVARLLRKTTGNASARGTLEGPTPSPAAFSLAYRSGDRERQRDVAFSGGTVSGTTIRPERPVENPATQAQLVGAIDPASALVVRAPGAGEGVCERTIRTFDGRARLDLVLSPRSERPFRADGWRGTVRVCDMAVQPIAGVRTKSLRTVNGIEGATVSFANLPGTNTWLAVEMSVPSPVGTVRARATRLDVTS